MLNERLGQNGPVVGDLRRRVEVHLAAFVFDSAALRGMAEDDVRKRGDKACGADSRRMCSKFFGDDMQVLACLQNNKLRLAKPCHKFLTEIGQLN